MSTISFFIPKDKTVGGENILKIFAKYSKLDKNIIEYSNTFEIIKLLLNNSYSNSFVITTLQKNNLLNMFFSLIKDYNPIIRETFLYDFRSDTLKNRFINIIYSLLIKLSKPLVIVQSENMKLDFEKKFGYLNTIIINNPIDPSVYSTSLKMDGYEKYIIFVGRLVKDKGVHVLISAYLKSTLPIKKIKLFIIGDGDYKQNLINITKKSIFSDMIVFWGNINNPFPLIKNSEFLVLPSFHEGFPNVILESIALDTLFLSNNLPSVKEMCLSNTSFLYTNYSELIEKMENFIHLKDQTKKIYYDQINKYKTLYKCERIVELFDKLIGGYIEKFNEVKN